MSDSGEQISLLAREIYSETSARYRSARKHMIIQRDLYYEVLYGPPRVNPPILFVGEQPSSMRGEEHEERTRDPP